MMLNDELLMYLARNQFAERLREAERRRLARGVQVPPAAPDQLPVRRPRIVR